MESVDYKNIKPKLRKYSNNVFLNMEQNGWFLIKTIEDAVGLKSKTATRGIKIDDFDLCCTRRVKDAFGVPMIEIYVKKCAL
jgi:hypothetical protein